MTQDRMQPSPKLRADKAFLAALRGVGVGNFRSMEESGEAHFLSKYLGPQEKPVVFDVGANTGQYSQVALAACPNAVIYAFEPHPRTFGKLEQALAAAGAHLFPIGLGDAEETVELFDRDDKGGSQHSSVYREVIVELHRREPVGNKIPIRRLDDVVSEAGVDRIALLKIDTEGHEMAVLRGAEQTIRAGRVDAIQFEFNSTNVMARTFFKDFWDFLRGYEFYRLLPDNAIHITEYIPLFCEIFAFQNIACLRPSASIFPNALRYPPRQTK